jgi:hypothetical protein
VANMASYRFGVKISDGLFWSDTVEVFGSIGEAEAHACVVVAELARNNDEASITVLVSAEGQLQLMLTRPLAASPSPAVR